MHVCAHACTLVSMCFHMHVYVSKCVCDYLQLENNVNSSSGKQLKMLPSDLSLVPDPRAECWALRKVVWAAYRLVALHSEAKMQDPREGSESGSVKHGSSDPERLPQRATIRILGDLWPVCPSSLKPPSLESLLWGLIGHLAPVKTPTPVLS